MNTLYLLSYNNYYNRIVKKESSLSDYEKFLVQYQGKDVDPNGNKAKIEKVNFIPADYVNTEQVVNWQGDTPDYLVVADDTGTAIDSRWFVIEAQKTRGGQLLLTLHRDVVVDFYDNIVDAPMFIEKATLEDSSPFIYNSEDMNFNQIKSGESLLQDETKSAWIVGYCTSKTETEDGSPLEISAEFNAAVGADEVVASIADYKYYQYSNLARNPLDLAGYPTTVAYCVYATTDETIRDVHKVCFNGAGGQLLGEVQITASGTRYNYTGSGSTTIWYADQWNPVCSKTSLMTNRTATFDEVSPWVTAFRPYYTRLKEKVKDYIPVQSEEDTVLLNNENGKVIYDSTEKKYYQVTVEKLATGWSETPIPSGDMYDIFLEAYNNRASIYDSQSYHSLGEWQEDIMGNTVPNENTFAIRTYGNKYKVILTELTSYGGTGYKIELGKDRYHLNDAPYDMFAIPYSDDLDIYKNGQLLFKSNKLLAFQAVMALVRKYQAAGYIYDLQLLPFCPVRSMIKAGNRFDVGDNVVNYITSESIYGSENIGIVVYASNSSDTFNIPFNITYENKKITALCDMYRLCSPNYNGTFEFNPAMNEGVLYFNVDFTYKPFNPYIHINPNFGGLYGQDWNDSRGLVCGGEFSLPAVANQWDTYELQNKNYQNIFDRQIQNMEVNNAIQREKERWGIASGVLGGGITGGISGGMAGGPWGAVAGAALGTSLSLIGGIRDAQLNEKLRTEALDYTKDMFGYNLQNIQALPYTLTRTTAFTYNNKVFPVLEYYTCTQEEKTALANKIAYNGMTVMAIGKMSEYIGNTWTYGDVTSKGYIKGRLIKTEGIADDFHIISTIADELYKGVFI